MKKEIRSIELRKGQIRCSDIVTAFIPKWLVGISPMGRAIQEYVGATWDPQSCQAVWPDSQGLLQQFEKPRPRL